MHTSFPFFLLTNWGVVMMEGSEAAILDPEMEGS